MSSRGRNECQRQIAGRRSSDSRTTASLRSSRLWTSRRGEWEALVGKAAGDEQLIDKKRRDAQAKAKLAELRDERKFW
jgi:hypothetical protein